MTVTDLVMFAGAVLLGAPMIRADVREHRLPNRLTGSLALIVLATALVSALVRGDFGRWAPMLLTGCAMALGGYLLAIPASGGLGLGDVKLLGTVGLALGHLDPGFVVVWLLALALATAVWLALAPLLDRAADRTVAWRKRHIAFGPPIIVAWWGTYVVVLIAWGANA